MPPEAAKLRISILLKRLERLHQHEILYQQRVEIDRHWIGLLQVSEVDRQIRETYSELWGELRELRGE